MSRPLAHRLAALLVLLLGACAGLPEGVPPPPAEDSAAGILTLPSGRRVSVDPAALTYTGRAHLRWPDGRVYEGEWRDGQPHGEGLARHPDGTRYRGHWQQGKRHGQGELTTPDGGHYQGEFHQGARQGEGTMTSAEGTYRGEWLADVPHGQGRFESPDGTRYSGEWRHGQRFGEGRYEGPDGSRYDGEWAYDQPHGFGRFTGAQGGSYEGEWIRGKQNGYGRSEGPPGLIYEGTWRDGDQHGYGREQRPDGSSYVGDWMDGKRHGEGRELHPDGSFHEGSWELNQALGPGLRHAVTGIEISGVWNHDTVSTGLVKLPTGIEYAGPLFSAGNTAASPRLMKWLQQTASHGDPYAQLLLGTLRLDLIRPVPDLAAARRWLGLAADAGIAEAQYRLALTYEDENPPRVVELLSRAAEQGHAGANEMLGDYYYTGRTVPKSLPQAIRYYSQAVEGGSLHARNNLAWLLATAADPAQRDPARAVALIRPIALYTGAWQYLDTLAAARAAAGEYQQAVKAAERALAGANRDPDAEAMGERRAVAERLARYQRGEPYVENAP